MRHWSTTKHKRPNRYEGYPALIKYSAFYGNNEIKLKQLENRAQQLEDELKDKQEQIYALYIAHKELRSKDHPSVVKIIVANKQRITNRIENIKINLSMVNAAIEEYKLFQSRASTELAR